MITLKINSDFTDFYDKLQDRQSNYTFNRYRKESKQRALLLKRLNNLGIQTIKLRPISTFLDNEIVVVYTNPLLHSSKGKKIMYASEAKMQYSNASAATFYDSAYTVKVIYVGKVRFVLHFNTGSRSLQLGDPVSIKMDMSDYNRYIGNPIYSIDYIVVDNKLIATDFNEVEKLDKYNLSQYISAEQVIEEITNSLLIYNKV